MSAPHLIFARVATVAVLAGVIAGAVVLGRPSGIRLQRLDRQRISDLRLLSRAIEEYRRTHDALPASLEKIPNTAWMNLHAKDPASGSPYEYIIKDRASYDLCATFQTVGSDDDAGPFWQHPAERHCFTLQVKGPVLQ